MTKKISGIHAALIAVILSALTGLAPPGPLAQEKRKEPRPTVEAARVETPPAMAALLRELDQAKREGDAAAVDRLHRRLGWTDAAASVPAHESPTDPEIVIRPNRSDGPLKWGGDTLVNDPQWSSGDQAMTCASDGTFYVVTVDFGNDGYLDLYASADGGASWAYQYSISAGSSKVYYPSIAIGEGTHNRLLIAYDTARYWPEARLVVVWWDLDTNETGSVTVDTYPDNVVGRPRICVDSPEYSVWYAYLTYARSNISAFTHELMFSRTIDYGVTWETPVWLATSLNDRRDHDVDFGGAGLFCAWSEFGASADLMANRSTDFGATFNGRIVLSADPRYEFQPSVAVANTGETVVVSYSADYGGGDTDIEAWVSVDDGQQWDVVYLPYNDESETYSDLAYDPNDDLFHAVYGRGTSVVTSHAAQATPMMWSHLNQVDSQHTAAYYARHSIAVDPTGTTGVGFAWMDTRRPDVFGVYFDASQVSNPSTVDYLMICPDDLVEQATVLARYRQTRGHGVELVRLSQIGPAPLSAAAIDQFVESFTLAEPQLRFLALIGTVDLIPGFLYDDGTDQWYSDLRYADTDGDYDVDYLPDIAVGRIPVTQADQLAAYIDKVKTFEQTFRQRYKVLFFGDQAEMSYVTNRDFQLATNLGYNVLSIIEPSEAQLLAALNDPSLAMVFYYGHGTFANNWPLHLGNLNAWTNQAGPVLYFSGGCDFNNNTLANQPLGHELLIRPGCAVSAAGATINGGYGVEYRYISYLLSDFSDYTTMGELHRDALIMHQGWAFDAGYDVSSGSWVHHFTERMVCHGDPALRIDGDVSAVQETAPGMTRLARNYPNPFNPRTTIRFELPVRSAVTLRVYDLEGRLVRTLLERQTRASGRHEVTWDGCDGRGAEVPSGIYMYRLVDNHGTTTGKMVLVR